MNNSPGSPKPPRAASAQEALARFARTGAGRHSRRLVAAFRPTYRTRLAVLPLRSEIPFLLNRRRLLGCGAEIGVQRGEFSEIVLEHWRGAHLISVDPWQAAPKDEYDDITNVAQEEHDSYYAETVERLARFGSRSTIWRQTGEQAAERIPHHSLDFVYLDARHDYDSVRSDLTDWYDKVRPGGIFAGHDYIDGHYVSGEYGVRSAVDEFCREKGLDVSATFVDRPWRSWWLSVPRPR